MQKPRLSQQSEKVRQATIFVQVIQLGWSKSARGGELAQKRSAIPTAFSLPLNYLDDLAGSIVVEEYHWGSCNKFAVPVRYLYGKVPASEGFRFGCVSLTVQAETTTIDYRWGFYGGALPVRMFMDATGTYVPVTKKLVLSAREWGRISYNGRFTCVDTGSWWYEQTTVNVAMFNNVANLNVFISTQPSAEYINLAKLW